MSGGEFHPDDARAEFVDCTISGDPPPTPDRPGAATPAELERVTKQRDSAREEVERLKAHARPVVRSAERGEPVDPEDLALLAGDVR